MAYLLLESDFETSSKCMTWEERTILKEGRFISSHGFQGFGFLLRCYGPVVRCNSIAAKVYSVAKLLTSLEPGSWDRRRAEASSICPGVSPPPNNAIILWINQGIHLFIGEVRTLKLPQIPRSEHHYTGNPQCTSLLGVFLYTQTTRGNPSNLSLQELRRRWKSSQWRTFHKKQWCGVWSGRGALRSRKIGMFLEPGVR